MAEAVMIILEGELGSRSVGTETPESDYDYMRVILAPREHYLGLDLWGQQGMKQEVSEGPGGLKVEITSYEFRKFLKMCSGFNPNVVPMLFLEHESFRVIGDVGFDLLFQRDMFRSKKAAHSFLGYAHGQMTKLGENGATGKLGQARKDLRAKYGFDTKYAYHAVRLARMLREYLENDGTYVNVWRKNIDAEELYSIRIGAWTLEQVKLEMDIQFKSCEKLLTTCNFPDEPDWKRINTFCVDTLRAYLL
jgi:uncharacterized protein